MAVRPAHARYSVKADRLRPYGHTRHFLFSKFLHLHAPHFPDSPISTPNIPTPLPESVWELCHDLNLYPSWGYVIYRTTYSAESDTHFSTIIKYLEACIKREFLAEGDSEDGSTKGDPAMYEGIWARRSFTIMEDAAQFDGASTTQFALISRRM